MSGSKMHAGMPEIDVHQVGRAAFEDLDRDLQLPAVMGRGQPDDVLLPKTFNEVLPRARGISSMSSKGNSTSQMRSRVRMKVRCRCSPVTCR